MDTQLYRVLAVSAFWTYIAIEGLTGLHTFGSEVAHCQEPMALTSCEESAALGSVVVGIFWPVHWALQLLMAILL